MTTTKKTRRVSNAKLLERIEDFETQFGEQLGVLRIQLNSLERINDGADEDVSNGVDETTRQLATLQTKIIQLTEEWNRELSILRAALTETINRVDFLTNSIFGTPLSENVAQAESQTNGQSVS